MDNKIKSAFDQIRADEKTIRHTKASLRDKSFDYGRNLYRIRRRRARLISTFALLFIAFTSLGVYKMPVAEIDIDINPSIELKINAFDKVVSAKGMNKDGVAVIEQLELENLKYTKAMRRILLSDKMESYLMKGDVLSITVVGGNDLNGEEILRNAVCSASAITSAENIYYCSVDGDVAKAAAEENLNVARYLALEKLREKDPSVTAEQVAQMSMKEVKLLIGCQKLDQPCDYYNSK